MTKGTLSLRGVFPPLTTPFRTNGDVDYDAVVENVIKYQEFDLAGYVVLGSNGEGVYLTEEEKLRVLKAVRQTMSDDRVLVAGTGCESTRATIDLTRKAADVGADAVLVVTPNYYDTKMTPEAMIRFFSDVADASPIPVAVYNVPQNTHVDLAPATITRAGEHPNIIGTKDSTGNVTKLAELVRLAPPGFQTLVGTANAFLSGLLLGVVGGVLALANMAPQECIDMQRLFEAGRLDEAAELQRRMVPVNTAVTGRFGIAGLKAAMDMVGFRGGAVRAPLMDLGEADRETLRQILVEGGLL